MKKTAVAPANIAFIKYWGKKDDALRLPQNNSISMNLSNAFTTTTVEFSPQFKKDEVYYDQQKMDKEEALRVINHVDRIRQLAKSKMKVKIMTKNSFPKGTGIASSASGFAALILAVTNALNLRLSERELSILARLGSGSAARSIPSGFVEWKAGNTSYESYAYSLQNEKYWDLRDIILIISNQEKKISSSEGHENAQSSIFFETRMKNITSKIRDIKIALKKRNIKNFGEIIEQEALELHAVMMTQKPPLFYLNGATLDIMRRVPQWRAQSLAVYFTLDAGPNIHLICEGRDEKELLQKIKELHSVKNVIMNTPAAGARLTNEHLF